MQGLRVHDFAEGLRLDRLPDPALGPGEVRVQVQACGVSFFDMLMSRGGYQWRPTLPFVVGSEFAGVVDALGDGAEGAFVVGDRVWGSTFIGAWTQRLCVPAGANASANLYSLLQTCLVNGIDGYQYLRVLLTALPAAQTADDYAALLPWCVKVRTP